MSPRRAGPWPDARPRLLLLRQSGLPRQVRTVIDVSSVILSFAIVE